MKKSDGGWLGEITWSDDVASVSCRPEIARVMIALAIEAAVLGV